MNPFSNSASSEEGLKTDSTSALNGAVAPVVTKQSFESGVHFHVEAIVSLSTGNECKKPTKAMM